MCIVYYNSLGILMPPRPFVTQLGAQPYFNSLISEGPSDSRVAKIFHDETYLTDGELLLI